MTKKELYELVIEINQEFYRQVTLNYDYIYNPPIDKGRNMDETIVNTFLDYLIERFGGKHMVSFDVIFDFIESSWNFWFDAKHLKFGTRSVQLGWIIGSKSIKRYEKIKHLDQKFSAKFRKVRRVTRNGVMTELSKKHLIPPAELIIRELVFTNDIEEEHKQRYYNTEDGLAWCIMSTSLFNPKSKACRWCNNKVNCKEILKANEPSVHRLRGL